MFTCKVIIPLVAAYNSKPDKYVSFRNSLFKRRKEVLSTNWAAEMVAGIV